MKLPGFAYVWSWNKVLGERKGQRCKLLVVGALNSALIEFEDGYLVRTDRRGLRRARR